MVHKWRFYGGFPWMFHKILQFLPSSKSDGWTWWLSIIVYTCLYHFCLRHPSKSGNIWQFCSRQTWTGNIWQYLAILSGNIYHSQPWTSASWESFEVAPLQPLSSPLRSSRSFRPVSWGRGDMVSTATWLFQQGTKWWKMIINHRNQPLDSLDTHGYPWFINRFRVARCRFAALHFGSLQQLLVRRLNGLIRLLIIGCQSPVGNQEPTPPQYPAGFLGRVTAIAVLGIGKLRQFMIINLNQRLFPNLNITLEYYSQILWSKDYWNRKQCSLVLIIGIKDYYQILWSIWI